MMEVPPIPTNAAEIPSPALLLHWESVEENIRRMLAMVDAPERLRPHLKTHKLPQVIARLLQLGVTKAKAWRRELGRQISCWPPRWWGRRCRGSSR